MKNLPFKEDSMSNEVIRKFFNCYKDCDFSGMQDCLDEKVKFSDFPFNKERGKEIRGKEVYGMWHWFCTGWDKREPIPPYFEDRQHSVKVHSFDILECNGETIIADYRLSYYIGKFGTKQRLIDYTIRASFKLENKKIIQQHDDFESIWGRYSEAVIRGNIG